MTGGNSMDRFLKKVVLTALCMTLTLPLTVLSQAKKPVKYPTKPIDLIVAAAPGAGTDMNARLIAGYATKRLGVPVNVVNVTGASGVTGMLQALRAAADGYTLLGDANFTSALMFATRTDLPLKLEERTFIARTITDYVYFFCHVDTGWKTLEDALQFIRSRPGEFRWGAGSYGSAPMFAETNLFLASGIDMDKIKKTRMVVFEKGNAPSLQACASGDVQFAAGMTGDVSALLSTGRVRALAVIAPGRTKEYPDIPTMPSSVIPRLTSWLGMGSPDLKVCRVMW